MTTTSQSDKQEVHEHHRIAGAGDRKFDHSHDDGSVPHRHPDHGPARFVREGAGRSARNQGPHLPYEVAERTFRVVIHQESLDRYHGARTAEGHPPLAAAAHLTIERMERAFHLAAVVGFAPEGIRHCPKGCTKPVNELWSLPDGGPHVRCDGDHPDLTTMTAEDTDLFIARRRLADVEARVRS